MPEKDGNRDSKSQTLAGLVSLTCVDVSRATFSTRCPRAVACSRLHNCLIRETLRPVLVELHEYCLESGLDYKRHQEEKGEKAERAEENEECGCVEKRLLFESSVVVTHFALMTFFVSPLTVDFNSLHCFAVSTMIKTDSLGRGKKGKELVDCFTAKTFHDSRNTM